MFEYEKMIELLEGKIAEAWAHNESGQQYNAIEALESVLNVLRNEQQAIIGTMDLFAMEAR